MAAIGLDSGGGAGMMASDIQIFDAVTDTSGGTSPRHSAPPQSPWMSQ
jgi:hypothetical protein